MLRKLAALVLVIAPLPVLAGGIYADAGSGAGPRPSAQLVLSNQATGGHTIASFLQGVPDEESAIESIGTLNNGEQYQQGAQFWRWVNSNNDWRNFESSWSMHLTGAGYDYTPLVLLARNSAILCAGYTPNQPWQGTDLPPAAWVKINCPQKVNGFQVIGTDLKYDRHWDTGLTVQGRGEFGDAKDGYVDRALQLGYSPSGATYIQGYSNATGQFLPMAIAGSDVMVGYQGQRVGFRGATPINVPVVTGSRSNGEALASLLQAMQAQGLIVDQSTP